MKLRGLLPWLLALPLLCGAPAEAGAQAASELRVRVAGAERGWAPVVDAVNLLEDRSLLDALRSGLPLRFRFRVELWRKGLFDRLVDSQESFFSLRHDPLADAYLLDTGLAERRYRDLDAAQAGISGILHPTLRVRGDGRFYYLVLLEVETLSLSDLDELRRWLRGDVRPAVEGTAPVGRAVERGLRRALVRLIGLPTRKYEARSPTFRSR